MGVLVSYSVRGEEPVVIEAFKVGLFPRVAMTIY
jgi:hypothetical protein